MIEGINHITVSVRNVEESFLFYEQVLGFRAVAKWPKGAYFTVGSLWFTIVLDAQTRPTSLPEYTHIAFTVKEQDFPMMCERLRRAGAYIWQENWTEGDSIYFIDPNGHKFELHVSDLEQRLKTAKEEPWEGLVFLE